MRNFDEKFFESINVYEYRNKFISKFIFIYKYPNMCIIFSANVIFPQNFHGSKKYLLVQYISPRLCSEIAQHSFKIEFHMQNIVV